MSLPSSKQLLVLHTASGCKLVGDDATNTEVAQTESATAVLSNAISKLSATHIDLDADAMSEADWDRVLAAVIEHPRNITL